MIRPLEDCYYCDCKTMHAICLCDMCIYFHYIQNHFKILSLFASSVNDLIFVRYNLNKLIMMNVNSNALKHGSQKVQGTSANDPGTSTVMSSIDTDISDLLKDTFDPTANKCNTMLKTVCLYNALELTADKSLLSRDGEIDRSLSEILDDLQKAVQADDVSNNNVSNLSFSDNQGCTYKDTSKDVNDQAKSSIEIQVMFL